MANKKCTLVIMAAGIGRRYESRHQAVKRVGPSGEIIRTIRSMTPLQQALIRSFLSSDTLSRRDFIQCIGDRIAKKVNVSYVFQETDDIPQGA